MIAELGSRFSQIGRLFFKKIENLKRGHTLEEEANVRRIILYPNTVSSSDIERHGRAKLDSAVLSAVHPYFGGNATMLGLQVGADALQKELERQCNLTPEQLRAEVIADAQGKAERWRLKSTVR